MEVLGICLPYVKRSLQKHQWSAFFCRAQITQILFFQECWLERDQRSHLDSNSFSKTFSTMEVLGMSTLALKYLRFYSFRECWFLSDQRSHFENDTFSKTFSIMEVLGMCLPYIKRYFQDHQSRAFFVRAQISQILFFLRMLLLESSKITVWERHLFQNFFFYGSLRYVSS